MYVGIYLFDSCTVHVYIYSANRVLPLIISYCMFLIRDSRESTPLLFSVIIFAATSSVRSLIRKAVGRTMKAAFLLLFGACCAASAIASQNGGFDSKWLYLWRTDSMYI